MVPLIPVYGAGRRVVYIIPGLRRAVEAVMYKPVLVQPYAEMIIVFTQYPHRISVFVLRLYPYRSGIGGDVKRLVSRDAYPVGRAVKDHCLIFFKRYILYARPSYQIRNIADVHLVAYTARPYYVRYRPEIIQALACLSILIHHYQVAVYVDDLVLYLALRGLKVRICLFSRVISHDAFEEAGFLRIIKLSVAFRLGRIVIYPLHLSGLRARAVIILVLLRYNRRHQGSPRSLVYIGSVAPVPGLIREIIMRFFLNHLFEPPPGLAGVSISVYVRDQGPFVESSDIRPVERVAPYRYLVQGTFVIAVIVGLPSLVVGAYRERPGIRPVCRITPG